MATVAGQWRAAAARFVEGGQELVEIDERFYSTGGGNSPPEVTLESPASPGTLAATEELVFTVTDPNGDVLDLQRILVCSGAAGRWEQAYRDGAACAGYSVTRTAITDGYRYRVTREGGWPPGAVKMEPVFADPTGASGINV